MKQVLFFAGMFITANVFANDPLPNEHWMFSKEIVEKAEKGDASAQFQLGHYLTSVRDRPIKNREEGIKWLIKSAEQGNEKAQFELGRIYYYGQNITTNETEGMHWYLKAAEQGNAEAIDEIKIIFENGQGEEKFKSTAYQKASAFLSKQAQENNPELCFSESIKYFNGNGVEKNEEKGLELMWKSSDHGYLDATLVLAQILLDGNGNIKKDEKTAVKLFMKVADAQNDSRAPVAQNLLGDCYYEGLGVESDVKEAVKWYQKAAASGEISSSLGDCYLNGWGVSKDEGAAFKCYLKSAEYDFWAQYMLSKCYKEGMGVEKNDAEYQRWFNKASEGAKKLFEWNSKNTEQTRRQTAQTALSCGRIYMYGIGVQKDENEAVKWFTKAAKNGSRCAQNELEDLQKEAFLTNPQ